MHHPPTAVLHAAPGGQRAGRRQLLALTLLCAAQFMLILDITVVNVALPSIQGDLQIALGDLSWVVTAYTLAFGGLILLGGRAGDRYGRRRLFLLGLAVFTAASLAAALATGTGALVAARAAQGVGAAMLSPSALALVTTTFAHGPLRTRALSVWAAVGAGGGAAGVLLGGLLTEVLGWRAIFLVNVPVSLVIAVGVARSVPGTRRVGEGRLDPLGALLATGSLVALTYGLVRAGTSGWFSADALLPLALAAAGFVAFVLVERRVRDPLVPLGVFRRRPVTVALLLMVLGMGPVFSGFYLSSLYLQQVLGHSALRTGVEFLPVAIAIVVAAHLGGGLLTRLGARPVVASGLAVAAGGAVLLSRVPADGTYLVDLLPGFLLLGAGGGLAAAGVMVTAMSGAGESDAGLVSGLTSTAHELSIALILPVLATVAASRVGAEVLGPAADPAGLAEGVGAGFVTAAVVALAGVLVALVLLRRGDVSAGAHGHLVH